MPTIEQIQQALTQVIDPELGKDIVELGMVRDIQLDEDEVTITLALTTKGCPLKQQLKEQTQAVVGNVPGVECVTVDLTTMTPEERQQLQDRLSPAISMNRIGQLIAVMSGKGGVGKSSVTALLAAALQHQGLAVGVLDADLTGPSIPRLFGISGPVPATPMGMMPIDTKKGVKVISTNLMLPEEDMAVLWRGPIMSGTIRQFWKDVLWGQLDYLLIDLPPGTSDATITVMQSLPIDGVVMVTTPQSLSSMVVRKTVNMCRELEIPIKGIVENMSYFTSPETGTQYMIFGPSHTQAVAQLAEAPILGQLPIDPSMTELADAGEIEEYEHAAYTELAAAFLKAVPTVEPVPAAPWMRE
ncbi:MAG: Mrp/NBP35 family ATP-binding protein [Anaerolineales bacterium]|jgi:Mrp family chromosome partitioning ATPase